MKFVNIRIKTEQELNKDFPGWKEGRPEYGTPTYFLRSSTNRKYIGKDVTEELSTFYANYTSIPDDVILGNGHGISKKLLVTYVPREKPEIRRLTNGFLKGVTNAITKR